MSKSMIKSLLNSEDDIMGFVQTFNGSFAEYKPNLKVFNFDICFNEN